MNNGTAAAATSGDVVKSLRITSQASIFTAELVALNLALDIIRRSRRKKFVIFSDSLSGLVAIRNCQLETAYVQKFIINYCQLVNAGNSIILIWIPVPGHTGIRCNKRADEAAKAALSSTVSIMKCPASDFIPELTMHYHEVWQAEWDGCSANNCTVSNLTLVTAMSHISLVVMLLF